MDFCIVNLPEIWSLIISFLPFFDITNLMICSKYFFVLCCQDKKFIAARHISHEMINKDKDNHEFFASFRLLRNEFGRYFKPYVFLSIRCLISDLICKMTSFRAYCYLFHCKRGFNVVNRCQYCTHFFVDSVRLSCAIQKSN